MENITFYEALGADLHNRLNRWYANHPNEKHPPRVTIHFSYSGWSELLTTIPPAFFTRTCTHNDAIKLFGGVRCVPYNGKWRSRGNYRIKIRRRKDRPGFKIGDTIVFWDEQSIQISFLHNT